jgi:hypothetical protein
MQGSFASEAWGGSVLDWCQTFLDELTWGEVLLAVGLFLGMFALSLAEVTFILVKLPANYFTREYHRFHQDHRIVWKRIVFAIVKNAIGLVHIAVGIALSVPGVPGQGVLTILLGVMLMDLPGVRRMERWLVSRKKVRESIDKIRGKFKKPPLILDGDLNPEQLSQNRRTEAASARQP